MRFCAKAHIFDKDYKPGPNGCKLISNNETPIMDIEHKTILLLISFYQPGQYLRSLLSQ
jgi:hypothetical protein